MLHNVSRAYGPRSNGGTAVRDDTPPRPSLTDFARRAVVAVLISVVVVAIGYFLWRGSDVLAQAFAGVLFAVFLNALAGWLSKHTGLAYRWSLPIVIIALFAVVGGVGYLLWSLISSQVGELTETMPRSFTEIKGYLEEYPWG